MNTESDKSRKVLILLPSLRISGGNKEAIRLAEDLRDRGNAVELVVFWKSDHDLPCPGFRVSYLSQFITNRSLAAVQFPLLLLRFLLFLGQHFSAADRKRIALILTHFSTYPFAWAAHRLARYCFIQDAEWMFVKEGGRRSLLRWFILATCRRSRVFTTNGYLETVFEQKGIQQVGRLSIWPNISWLASTRNSTREIDVVMLLRRTHSKRLDLYFEVLNLIKQSGFAACVLSPDADLLDKAADLAEKTLLRPSQKEFKEIYGRSKIFLLLSETEGFGLPPVEAMGSGCIPLCRDSGGPRCFMTGVLEENLLSLNEDSEQIFKRLQALLSDPLKLAALSEAARIEFASGVAFSVVQRNECVAALSEMLHQDV